jgi:hypothetical protein
MKKSWKIGLAVLLLVALGAGVGVLIWRLGGPFGPGRQLVGEWAVLSTDFEDQILEAIEKQDPDVAQAAGRKFRSTSRMVLNRNGTFLSEEAFLGLTMTLEGTWQVTALDGKTLSIKCHKTRLSVRNPKGETTGEAQDEDFEWIVTVIEPGRLSAYAAHDKKRKPFELARAGN